MKILRAHHVAVICSNYGRSKAFYTEVLGLEVIREVHRAERQSYKLDLALPDGTQVELFSFPDPPPLLVSPGEPGAGPAVPDRFADRGPRRLGRADGDEVGGLCRGPGRGPRRTQREGNRRGVGGADDRDRRRGRQGGRLAGRRGGRDGGTLAADRPQLAEGPEQRALGRRLVPPDLGPRLPGVEERPLARLGPSSARAAWSSVARCASTRATSVSINRASSGPGVG